MKAVKILVAVVMALSLTSCADSKEFVIDGKKQIIEPYGWFDLEAKHDSIVYKVNVPNAVIGVIFAPSIVVPVLLTGDQLFEPAIKKNK